MSTDSQVIDWLLTAQTPTIRYRTRLDLLGQPDSDPQVAAEHAAMMSTGPVPAILAHQSESGAWQGEHSYYTPKFVSSHWSLTLLSELGVDSNDQRFQRGVELMLAATAVRLQERLATETLGFSCFWGNLLRYALHAGRVGDPRLAQIVDYAVRDVQNDGCRCEYNDQYPCAWGVGRTLWGLAALPAALRTLEVEQTIHYGLEFLLSRRHLLLADYPLPENGAVHSLWFRLNFPLFYKTDILFILRLLAELGALDHPGAQPALDWLQARRAKNGRWRGSSPYRRRTWAELGDSEETDRWITLQAQTILRHRQG